MDDVISMFGSKEDGLKFQMIPLASITKGIKGTIAERFEQFHRMNPHVYTAIVEVALDLKKRGFRKGGMKMIFERLRWLYAIQTQGDVFLLNNSFTSCYARVVMETVPALDGFFETRLRHGEDPYTPDLATLGFR